MNFLKVADDILKQSVRFVSKKKFDDKIDFEGQVLNFISSIQSNLVKLKLRSSSFKKDKTIQPYQHWKFEFEVFFDLDDPYIDSKVYESGTVHIFPSKKMYGDINKNSMNMFGAYPEWNETKNIATITGNARDY
jgi:hypothetical protein